MKQNLHILFLCGWYPSRVFPTNGDFIQRHAEAVSKQQKVTVLHIVTDDHSVEDIEIVSKKSPQLNVHIAYVKPQKNALIKIALFWKAYQLLLKKVIDFDIIHLNEIYPFGIFAKLTSYKLKKPYLISEHFTGYLKASNLKTPFFQKLISKYIVKKAFAICNVSDYLSNNMKEMGFKGNFVTVPNVVDTDIFTPKKIENVFLKLVHVSNLKDAHKNISGMLRVAKLLDEKLDYFEWKFVGNNGNEYKDFLQKLNLKNGKVSFLEHQNQKEIAILLQEATICISFSNYETFGIVITEAIASGTPVISTNTGIAMDLKTHDFCSVIPIKDEEALFQEILNAKKTFENIDVEKMHAFVKQEFSKEIILNKFSLLYYQSLKK
ncbi:glycosyltransferase family 4 protein [Polaribacter sp. MSW13]|uniref:Glycosyltransferase family 4 protein n=1 Tax=Polaribacter marinus TaxID=2916838 RepID=A0A9X1VPE9_9FLAO|nr:glycosyltransferase family 4 protein [Polaribacter marinus]MCI2229788.1 glycosyltransferase family 4 protein [Polaribacter marinus]